MNFHRKEYMVYGITEMKGSVWFLLFNSSVIQFPIFYPAMFFEIIDPRLSRFWVYSFDKEDLFPLGTRQGRKGKYPKAREFDGMGRPVKDIEFTDHGRPQDHPCPHGHRYKENPTGGTRQRSDKAEFVQGWLY